LKEEVTTLFYIENIKLKQTSPKSGDKPEGDWEKSKKNLLEQAAMIENLNKENNVLNFNPY
jgi:hypothetical protein